MMISCSELMLKSKTYKAMHYSARPSIPTINLNYIFTKTTDYTGILKADQLVYHIKEISYQNHIIENTFKMLEYHKYINMVLLMPLVLFF